MTPRVSYSCLDAPNTLRDTNSRRRLSYTLFTHQPPSTIHHPQGDILDYLPPQKTAGGGIVILEEPEHLNWHRVGGRWSDHFSHVAGVAHTNYRAYAREHPQLPLVKDQLLRIFSVSYSVLYELQCVV